MDLDQPAQQQMVVGRLWYKVSRFAQKQAMPDPYLDVLAETSFPGSFPLLSTQSHMCISAA